MNNQSLSPKTNVEENKNSSRGKVIKFCMFTTQRSGSTWLMDLLNSHPKIKVYDELFLNMTVKSKWVDENQLCFYEHQKITPGKRPWKTIKYLNNIHTYDREFDAVGFKLMYDQLYRKPEVLVNLILDGYKFVHLVRENSLDVVVSYAIARSNRLFCTEKEFNPNQIYLEPSILLKELKKQDFKVNLARFLLSVLPNPVVHLTYDDLRENQSETLNAIVEFLGLPGSEQNVFSSNLKKINPHKHQEVIANYEEVKQALEGTKFYQYLELSA